MHNSINIPLSQPIIAALQHALYNFYYDMCCAKAGVAVQLCGWIYGVPLNTRHSNDTCFIKDTEILQSRNYLLKATRAIHSHALMLLTRATSVFWLSWYRVSIVCCQHLQRAKSSSKQHGTSFWCWCSCLLWDWVCCQPMQDVLVFEGRKCPPIMEYWLFMQCMGGVDFSG